MPFSGFMCSIQGHWPGDLFVSLVFVFPSTALSQGVGFSMCLSGLCIVVMLGSRNSMEVISHSQDVEKLVSVLFLMSHRIHQESLELVGFSLVGGF